MENDDLKMRTLLCHVLALLGNFDPSEQQLQLAQHFLAKTCVHCGLLFHKKLSAKEAIFLFLAAKGHSARSAAELLNIKTATVSAYHKEIKRKLNCKTLAQAVYEGMNFSTT